jgi:hypothetical protein
LSKSAAGAAKRWAQHARFGQPSARAQIGSTDFALSRSGELDYGPHKVETRLENTVELAKALNDHHLRQYHESIEAEQPI